ncbi:MAG: hypothetical protein K2Q10_12455 [Rhodospirillales bacterium]|nr:hypothetical protein [Rhodospirillales bacterium]
MPFFLLRPGLPWFSEAAFSNLLVAVEWRVTAPEDNSGLFPRIPPLADAPDDQSWQPAMTPGIEV